MMFDLKHGILELDDFPLGPNTTLEALTGHIAGTRVTKNDRAGAVLVRCTKIALVGGAAFLPEIHFSHHRLSLVLLRPAVRYPAQVTSAAEKQEFRYAACARWLSSRLGQPDSQTPGESRYDFDWGSVSAVAHLLPEDACDGGYLCLRYGRNPS